LRPAVDLEFSLDPTVPEGRRTGPPPVPAPDGGGSRYISVPPPHACIVGEKAKASGVVNNLMSSFVDMKQGDDDDDGGERKGFGMVISLKEARVW